MHGYILSITFGNAIDFHSMGLVYRKKEEGVSKLTPPSLRDTSPKNFSNFQEEFLQLLGNIAVPLFFAEKEGDENCELQFGGGYSPQIK